jgi:hypothetical protein
MPSVSYYRTEAAHCRALALAAGDPVAAARWSGIASDYEKLANSLESVPFSPPLVHVPMQQRPMQQQQSKSEPEDKT